MRSIIFLLLWMATGWEIRSQTVPSKKNEPASLRYLPRHEYGQKLEPAGKIYSGAGQYTVSSFESYLGALDSVYRPALFMDYADIRSLNRKHFRESIAYWNKLSWKVIPQIGLSMTQDGKPENHYEHQVAIGLHDTSIYAFCRLLNEWKGPVMIRLGYEFNGHWNGYHPDAFKVAYERVARILREELGDRLALVWCMALDGDRHDYMNFYPGDEWVDWWSVDVFGENHFTHKALQPFLDSAHAHRRPVLIGECSPRRVSVQLGEESVRRWFRPFFEMVAKNPGIKGISYIYWDWTPTRWTDWGDGCFGKNPETLRYFREQMAQPIFRHGSRP